MKDMDIYDVLIDLGVRLSNGKRWLVLSEQGEYEVYEDRGRKGVVKLIQTENENDACEILIK